ncbi:hypothetical protein WISP_113704 [Willisornis vidua]|uniref:Uncharacterized protein n=1 Tax=Willisornis vidua TaxID=1566151 RepID=A0ABQ9D0W2_9PASS|nr:hypothetical protein WISP_113704 [Willisornis vidua]
MSRSEMLVQAVMMSTPGLPNLQLSLVLVVEEVTVVDFYEKLLEGPTEAMSANSKMDSLLAKIEPLSDSGSCTFKKGEQHPVQLQQKRGVRYLRRTALQIPRPVQLMLKTMLKQAVPL